MRGRFGIVPIMLLAAVMVLAGCGSKNKTTAGPATDLAKPPSAVQTSSAEWGYDAAPTPPFTGAPDYMLVSFGFDENDTAVKREGMGACREAIKKIKDKPETRLVAIGFADGIKEKDTAEPLGLRRAESVREFLSTIGVVPDRVQVSSFGSKYSTARDFEKIKQSRERKVEIWVLQTE